MDALQRPLRWSPNAVASWPTVCDPSHKRRVAPDILLAKLVGSWLPVLLCDSESRAKHGEADYQDADSTYVIRAHANLLNSCQSERDHHSY